MAKIRRPITFIPSKKSSIHTLHNALKKDQILDPVKLNEYQLQSLKGSSKAKCGKWLIPKLTKPSDRKLKLLDVGAVDGNDYRVSWIDPLYIDLNPQSPRVRKIDFFDFPPISVDIVCLALVLNFGQERARMLERTRSFLSIGGLLYIVLPLKCITHSRYLTHEHFNTILASLGFQLIEHHFSARLAYYLFKCQGEKDDEQFHKSVRKKLLSPGGNKNNFCIT